MMSAAASRPLCRPRIAPGREHAGHGQLDLGLRGLDQPMSIRPQTARRARDDFLARTGDASRPSAGPPSSPILQNPSHRMQCRSQRGGKTRTRMTAARPPCRGPARCRRVPAPAHDEDAGRAKSRLPCAPRDPLTSRSRAARVQPVCATPMPNTGNYEPRSVYSITHYPDTSPMASRAMLAARARAPRLKLAYEDLGRVRLEQNPPPHRRCRRCRSREKPPPKEHATIMPPRGYWRRRSSRSGPGETASRRDEPAHGEDQARRDQHPEHVMALSICLGLMENAHDPGPDIPANQTFRGSFAGEVI